MKKERMLYLLKHSVLDFVNKLVFILFCLIIMIEWVFYFPLSLSFSMLLALNVKIDLKFFEIVLHYGVHLYLGMTIIDIYIKKIFKD